MGVSVVVLLDGERPVFARMLAAEAVKPLSATFG
jgi:hypothetical protein